MLGGLEVRRQKTGDRRKKPEFRSQETEIGMAFLN
jgi:hypothetical protein